MTKIFLETGDIAKALSVVTATVRQWIRAGQLRPFAITSRGTNLFRMQDLQRLKRRRESSARRARSAALSRVGSDVGIRRH